MNAEVILVEDEEHLRTACAQTLELASIKSMSFANADGVVEHIGRQWHGVLVTDIKMPGVSGLDLMAQVLAVDADLPVILVTGHGDVPMAVQAMRDGAYDFIEKPFTAEVMVDAVRRALEKRRLVLDNRRLRIRLEQTGQFDNILRGRHEQTRRLREKISRYAATDADVLIHGETGTGKELAARSLHDMSQRAAGRFVAINCGALPDTIIESELFGHEAGAFTGAVKKRIGKFEHAVGGSLFLDEIESMPFDLQIRLLRVLQERVIVRLGSNEEIPVDVRVIAASKSDLLAASEQGDFREDLFFRLNVLRLEIPPLRERIDDAPELFQHFISRAVKQYACDPVEMTRAVTDRLLAHDWPGNIRELQNVALRYALGFGLDIRSPEPGAVAANEPRHDLAARLAAFEADLIRRQLLHYDNKLKPTYEALGISRKTLYDKIRKYGISSAADSAN